MDSSALILNWHRPDNTSNLFSAVSNESDPHVFHMTIELKERISPRILQGALEQTLPYFRAFDVRYKQHFFGSRFESQIENPVVSKESNVLCRHFTSRTDRGFLFRVLYGDYQIHLEVFHALTDGAGALEFLKAIVYRYIQLAHPMSFDSEQKLVFYGIENADNVVDAYARNYRKVRKAERRDKAAYNIKGKRKNIGNIDVTSLCMKVSDIKAVAKSYEATIGEYITATIILGLINGYKDTIDKPISIELPVNLRPIFQMETSLNFFSNVSIILNPEEFSYSFEEILHCVKKQCKEKINKEMFERRIGFTVWGEKCLVAQMTPVIARNWFLRRMYEICSNNNTLGFSNLGNVRVVKAFEQYVKSITAFASPTPMVPIKIVACSVNDEFHMTVSTRLYENILLDSVVSVLKQQGLSMVVKDI